MDLKGTVFEKSLNFKAGLQNIWKGYNQVGPLFGTAKSLAFRIFLL